MPLSTLAGNRPLKEQLLPRLSAHTLGHAFILSGPAGSGKGVLASILARAMVCSAPGTRPCGSCSDCKKALAGIHPDIITIAPLEPGKEIVVDQVRQMRADAYIRPNEAQRKVYVVEQAHQLNSSAQNAMLKLLEEGPSYAAFLLLTEHAGALLSTVRSRCEMLTLTAPEEARTEEEPMAELARTVVDLWLSGDERGLMEQCVPMEKWERTQFATLLDHMTDRLCALLPGATDRRRMLKGVQLVEQLRQATARNVGPGALSGWLCAACGKE